MNTLPRLWSLLGTLYTCSFTLELDPFGNKGLGVRSHTRSFGDIGDIKERTRPAGRVLSSPMIAQWKQKGGEVTLYSIRSVKM